MEFERVIVGALFTNCYVLKCGDSGIIIDPGDEADMIMEEVRDLKIEMILLTHNHPDHTGALQEVKRATGVPAAIHSLDWHPGFDLKLKEGKNN
jgi:hydroxyacylglutathione hydrolase